MNGKTGFRRDNIKMKFNKSYKGQNTEIKPTQSLSYDQRKLKKKKTQNQN